MTDISLRREVPEDEAFLFKLYCSTRAEEIAAWGWPPVQQNAFLKMQFNGQRHSYRSQFPEAEHHVILLQTDPIGRLLVSKNHVEFTLVDIALLPEQRNRGIGSALLRNLLAEATSSNRKVRLHVLKSNPAQNLYSRLGFSRVSEDGLYSQMEWIPEVSPAPLTQ
ncbi:GNAT family N-acetyltransferase [Pedosphaera parvula]|uniref:GCN5-related N-acetyltransferase n=1 Tax=Pedosphaera parvula (strain Ellin514) TaxID=320771 RepID=B9XBK8_PEDPL|nr:GNAT family N-acetyltransferase [Pedosphaera parvula]EEF62893.1 GCN5-related N-acetyltransferase [Pedosphaera parvula Ellin514]